MHNERKREKADIITKPNCSAGSQASVEAKMNGKL